MQEAPPADEQQASPYAWYVLSVLLLIYVFNFIDRQILSILAEDVKRDLGITDSEIGFLYGTVFGVFYALFGIPLGRLADMWHRMRLLTIGLALWSGMTALSGLSRNFAQLATARILVGVGEASASPVAYSVLSDYFPKRQRATALSIYSSGIYLGSGLSLFLGGLTVDRWNRAFPAGDPWFGLAGWQAAFLAVGLPGLLLAFWASTLKEPVRGLSEGIVMPAEERPFRKFLGELESVLPPFTLLSAARNGRRALLRNLGALALAAAFIAGMSQAAGNWPQWLSLGLAAYAVFSWSEALSFRDPPTHALIWGTPTFLLMVLGFGLVAIVTYAYGFWGAPYAIRTFGADRATAGFFLGGGGATAGFLGIIAGGRLADRWRLRHPSGRIRVGFATILLPIPFALLQYTTSSESLFYLFAFLTALPASLWVGLAGATAQDLVLPRMRGAATATFFLGTTVIGLGLGPFLGGRLSELLGSLGHAMIALALTAPLPFLCLLYVYRHLPAAEASRLDRARAAGEPV